MTDLFGKPEWRVVIDLSKSGLEKLSRPIVCKVKGGHQGLLEKLNRQVHRFRLHAGEEPRLRLVCDRSDVDRIVRYRTQYGKGGYRERLSEPSAALLDLVNVIVDALKLPDETKRKATHYVDEKSENPAARTACGRARGSTNFFDDDCSNQTETVTCLACLRALAGREVTRK